MWVNDSGAVISKEGGMDDKKLKFDTKIDLDVFEVAAFSYGVNFSSDLLEYH